MIKKHSVIILTVSVVFLFAVAGIMLSMKQIGKQTDDNTAFYSATVSKVSVTDTGKDTYAEIQINEYDTDLQISTNISKNINTDAVRDLQNGQKIFFRIENSKNGQMNKVEFVNIVSLKTEDKEIFTLDDYNEYISRSAYPARIAGIIIALLLVTVAVLCIISIVTKAKSNTIVKTKIQNK